MTSSRLYQLCSGILRPLLRHRSFLIREVHRDTPKFCTTATEENCEELETFEGPIPTDKLTVKFSKSSGPGGQNVNKLNTKAEVRFHVDSADWLPLRVKTRLRALARFTKDGELVVTSQEHRTQQRNLAAAVDKLARLVQEASEIPRGPSQLTRARVTLLKRKTERRRLMEKKYHSQKKADRRTDGV